MSDQRTNTTASYSTCCPS